MVNWYLTGVSADPKTHTIKGTAEHGLTKSRAWFESTLEKTMGSPDLIADLAGWIPGCSDPGVALDTWLIWLESGGIRNPADIVKAFNQFDKPLDTQPATA